MASPVLAEGRRTAEFMMSEANGMRSRDVGTFINSGTVEVLLPAGLVLGKLAADSSYAGFTNAGTLGLQTAAAVLWDNVRIAASGTVTATIITRSAEVNDAELQWVGTVDSPGKALARTSLRAIGIIPR